MTTPPPAAEMPTEQVYCPAVGEDVMNSPLFNAVWEVVKHWDIGVPSAYGGYCAGNGSHVAAIVNAIIKSRLSAPPLTAAISKERLTEIRKRHDAAQSQLEFEGRAISHSDYKAWKAEHARSAHADRAELLAALKQ